MNRISYTVLLQKYHKFIFRKCRKHRRQTRTWKQSLSHTWREPRSCSGVFSSSPYPLVYMWLLQNEINTIYSILEQSSAIPLFYLILCTSLVLQMSYNLFNQCRIVEFCPVAKIFFLFVKKSFSKHL